MHTDSQFTLIAKTVSGLEPLLANELSTLGATEILPLTRAVSFNADKQLMYRANYELRTALRVLKPIFHFVARNENALYDGVAKFHWHELFSVDQTFAIDAVVSGTAFTHSHYVALKTKDAIVDQFRERFGARPS
ncbi:MAG TPA: THUMP domain-containing protein, partial [Bacteroidales bacterium]|nr:THUMP domain-containing protein [Bacteroidales bacterium]